MNEVWKDVVDFEGIYQISSSGHFRRNPSNPRKAKYPLLINYLGYVYVSISKQGTRANKTIHQMVAAAFIPNFKYGMHINHIDGNKQNNVLSNLELSNYVHNNTHAHTLTTTAKPGKSKYRNVSIRFDKRNKHPKIQYMASVKINSKRNFIGLFDIEEDAAKAVDAFLDSIGDKLRIRNFP
jgi:hypothetical protein